MGMYIRPEHEKLSGAKLDAAMRAATEIDCSADPMLVKQEFVQESDVNVIIARCLRNGTPLPGADVQGVFADITSIGDFAAARQRILDGEAAFMTLPAALRAEFGNDPAQLVPWLADPDNRDRGIKLGLIAKPPEPPAPVPVPALPAKTPKKASVDD